MYYIHHIASITHQDSFRSKNVFESLVPLDAHTELQAPDFKEFIPPASLRRLSPVLKLGLTAAMECKTKCGRDFDAISVGTSLGCLRDTEKFLETVITSTNDFLSPTAFIQSTHNTIGGQISLGLGNHAYNMTHTQNSLSFEIALVDAMLCAEEGKSAILVGAADEKIDFLSQLQPNLLRDQYPLSSGASFFVISKEKSNSGIGVQAIDTFFAAGNIQSRITEFLKKENVEMSEIALVIHSGTQLEDYNGHQINFLDFTGLHYSASSFALHMAHDFLLSSEVTYVLIVNDMCEGTLGLCLVKKA